MKSIIIIVILACIVMSHTRKAKNAKIENCEEHSEYMLLSHPMCAKCKEGFMVDIKDGAVTCMKIAEAPCKDLECEVCDNARCTKCKTGKIAFNNLCMEDKKDAHKCVDNCAGCSGDNLEICFSCKLGFSMESDPATKKNKCVSATVENCAVAMPGECALCHHGFVNHSGKCAPAGQAPPAGVSAPPKA
jgi:hypothetical protein